jgi:hypothetical protein
MIVIAQCHVQGCDGAQLFEESKERGQTFRYVDQITRDENPIRVEISYGCEDTIMPRLISIQVKIREMDCTTTSQSRMCMGKDGNSVIGQTPFPIRDETEQSVEWLAQTVAD